MNKRKYLSGLLFFSVMLIILPMAAFAVATENDKMDGDGTTVSYETVSARDESDNPFLDVFENDYYYNAVLWAVEQGITAGTTDDTFSPDTICTRGQMVTFLWRAIGSPETQHFDMPFIDICFDDYYYNAVAWAVEQGITAGTSATTFSPDDTITRAQAVTFLFRAMGSPDLGSQDFFVDVPADAYYAPAVSWATAQGVTSGTGSTTFSPNDACTRGQIVTFLFRSQKKDIPSTFEAHSIATDELDTFRYWLYTPSNPTQQMPLIVYLHGGSGKGDDLNLIISEDGFPKYLQTGELGDIKAYVLIPQLPSTQKGWAGVSNSLYDLIHATVSKFDIDANNISLTGHSMGGTGTWSLAATYPTLFSRIAPLSGSVKGTAETIKKLNNIPVWAFVGSIDTIVPPVSSEEMVAELNEAGGTAEITVFNGADHFAVPSLVYLSKDIDLIHWLIGE